MLKPFRIRELRDDSTSVAGSGSGRRDGVVQVSGPEYDSTISKYPEASLMYMDDDDGEVITVGSSLELGQRLDEPFDLRHRRRSRNLLRQGILSPPSMSTMHIFDINRTKTALDVWIGFEMKDRGLSATLRRLEENTSSPQSGPSSQKPDSDMKVHVDASDDAARLKELEDERQRWFWACNPPRMVPVQVPTTKSSQTPNLPVTSASKSSVPTTESSSGTLPQLGHWSAPQPSSLTSEARKQAQDAAAKFRGWKNPAIADANMPSQFLQSAYQNRWASYNQDNSFNSSDPRILSTNPDDKSLGMKQPSPPRPRPSIPVSSLIIPQSESEAPPPVPDRPQLSALPRDHEPPFLDAFEAEMAKMLALVNGDAPAEEPPKPSENASQAPEEARPADQPNPLNPGEVLVNTIQSLVEGVGLLGTELKNAFPGLERNISNAQQQLPSQVDRAVRGALEGLGNQMGNLATSMHTASDATRQAAERTRETDLRAFEGAVGGLLEIVDGFGAMGKTLFTAFEAEFPGNQPTPSATSLAAADPPRSPPRSPPSSIPHSTTESSGKSVETQIRFEPSEKRIPIETKPVPEVSPVSLPKGDEPTSCVSVEQESSELNLGQDLLASTFQPRTRRVHRNVQLHPFEQYHAPSATQPSPVKVTEGARSRSPVSKEDGNPDMSRGGRSRSPPSQRRPRAFEPRRHGPSCAHRRHDEPHVHHYGPYGPPHPPPHIYSRFPPAVGGPTLPSLNQASSDNPSFVRQYPGPGIHTMSLETPPAAPPPGFPPLPRHHHWSRPGHHPGHSAIRHRRSWYPGFRPDQNLEQSTPKTSAMFAEPVNAPDAGKAETSEINRARRVRSVGFLYSRDIEQDTAKGSQPETTQAGPSAAQHTSSPSTILDQDVADPTFSVRFPSLVANNDLRRNNTTGSSLGKGKNCSYPFLNMDRSALPPGIPPPPSLESEMVRFPTLSQFEEQTHKDHFKSNASKKTEEVVTPKVPGSWPPQSDQPNAESSGQFFARMTGLKAPPTDEPVPEPKIQLSRSKTMTSANPAARLLRPFDPLSNSFVATQDDGLRRSATDRVSHRRAFNGDRRPYSEHFSGDGRMGWESFLQQYEKTPGSFPTNNETDSQRQLPTLPKFEPSRRNAGSRARAHRPILKVDTTSRPSQKPKTQTQNERCVDHLKMLGFGSKEDGGEERLVVYAEAAEGNLEDAIEMIEEERKAYKQRRDV